MTSRSLSETIQELMQTSKRAKTLEIVKNRLFEWPETVEDYSRLVLALMNNSRSTLGQTLCALELVVDEFTKCVSATYSRDFPTHAISKKLVQFCSQLFLTESNQLVAQEGAVEYMCKLVKTLSSGLFQMGTDEGYVEVTCLVIGLLELPVSRPRQTEIIKSAVWIVFENFRADLTSSEVSALLAQAVKLFERFEKLIDMTFAVSFSLWILRRAPILVPREIVPSLFSHVASLLPPGSEPRSAALLEAAIDTLRFLCLLILSHNIAVDRNYLGALVLFLKEQKPALFTVNFFKITDLSVDLLLIEHGSFEKSFEQCGGEDELIATRLVERWSSMTQFEDIFFVEAMLKKSTLINFSLLTAALIEKLNLSSPFRHRCVYMSHSILVADPAVSSFSTPGQFEVSRGARYLLHQLSSDIFSKIFETKPLVASLRCFLSLSRALSSADIAIVREKLSGWVHLFDKSDPQASLLVAQVVVEFKIFFDSVEQIVLDLSHSLEPKYLFSLISQLVGVETPLRQFRVPTCQVELLRECFAMRSLALLTSITQGNFTFEKNRIVKAFSFTMRLVKRALSQTKSDDRDSLAHLLAVYVILGSLDSGIQCEACLLTSGLSEVSRSPARRSTFLLKNALLEATEILNTCGIALCQCSLHKDALGEPRSLLSQAPVTVRSFVVENACKMKIQECVFGEKILMKRKLQNIDTLSMDETLDLAEQLLPDDAVQVVTHLVERRLKFFFSQHAARLALFIARLNFQQPSEPLLSFLANTLFAPEGGNYTAVVAARETVPVLVTAFDAADIVRDVMETDVASLSGTALRLAVSLCVNTEEERKKLVGPILVHGEFALYVVDELVKILKNFQVGKIVVHACMQMDPELLALLAEELEISDLVSGVTQSSENGIASVALSVLKPPGSAPQKPNINPFSPLDVLLVCLALKQFLKEVCCDPIPVMQSLVRLSERPWFLAHLVLRHPNCGEYVRKLVGDSLPSKLEYFINFDNDQTSTKRARLECKTLPSEIDWPLSALLAFDYKVGKEADLMSLARSGVFLSVFSILADSTHLSPHHVPLLYATQSLVSADAVPVTMEVIKFVMDQKKDLSGLVPDPFSSKLFITHHKWTKTYPISALCRLTGEILDTLSISPALASVAAADERLSTAILPFLILIADVSQILNKFLADCAKEIALALAVAARLEFLWTNSRRCVLGQIFNLNLIFLSEKLLSLADFHGAYFYASLVQASSSSPGDLIQPGVESLFAPPAGSLPIVLSALFEMGIKIDSFSLSLHASIRSLVSRLRNDSVSLLYEENEVDFSAALKNMRATDLASLNKWKVSDLTDRGIEKLLSGGQIDAEAASVMREAVNLPRYEFLRKIPDCKKFNCVFTVLQDLEFFPPNLHDMHNSALLALVVKLRKEGMLHKARIVADFAISRSLSPTTCPAIRLGVFYALAKTLWKLSLFSEATRLVTSLTVCEEISRSDVEEVAQLAPRVFSRAALWVGERRVESLEEIRSKYFAKAIRESDFKSTVKAKMRFVQVLDPLVACKDASTVQKPQLVEEFTLICEILSSGVVGSQKSVWFASRLVSLWFAHPAVTTPVVAKFRKNLAASTSLLPFFYQVVGRIGRSEESAEFRKELVLLIIEIAKTHLLTCLAPILQLRTGTQAVGKSHKAVDAERSKQADLIVEKLRSFFPAAVDSMIAAFRFYLNLAMAPVVPDAPSAGSSTRAVSNSLKKRHVAEIEGFKEYAKHFSAATVLTSDRNVALKSVNAEFAVAESGRSLPKILTLVDVEGKIHKQIVKGNDDLRNDAVLQQLFSLLDDVRSYKVVPITASAGIAEWVSNTLTLGGYLVGYPSEAKGAHMRHHPKDIAPSAFKTKMVQIRQQQGDLLTGYKSMCAEFQPAMRHFFYEHFVTPRAWFKAQSSYVDAVAATSIVGFIVGLGDRHPNNILIDVTTGEVVHIDYGICFDAGRQLKIPEIVPFRLTRDMVDGLGCLGTQGPFSKSCQDVLVDLKKKSSLVTAVVEVFVADPLFNWAVASLGSDNAQSALEGVRRKLQGFLDSADVIPLTPAAQVDRLIQMATDPRYLSQMFAGWQAWL